MHEYTPNSHKYRAEHQSTAPVERKKVEKVVSGPVKTKKRSEIRKLAEIFIVEDVKNVKNYVIDEIVIPTIRDTIWSIFTNSLDMFIYGGTGKSGRKNSGPSHYVSYRNYADRKVDDRHSYDSPRSRVGYGYEDIILESWAEADEVLTRMSELIDEYGEVSVADLYDLVGKSCSYTDNKYGWTNLRNAEPMRVRDGYMLKLPKALTLNK